MDEQDGNPIPHLLSLLSQNQIRFQEMADLAQRTMDTEDAVVFCIEPCLEFESFIGQLLSNVILPNKPSAQLVYADSDLLFGYGDYWFSVNVSQLLSESVRENYLKPATMGHVICFIFSRGYIHRIDMTPGLNTLH